MPCVARAWLGSRGRPLTANSIMHPTKSWLSTCPRLFRTGSKDLMPPTVTRFGWTSRVLHEKERCISTNTIDFSRTFGLKTSDDNFVWHVLHIACKFEWKILPTNTCLPDTYRIIRFLRRNHSKTYGNDIFSQLRYMLD